jgi:magnesium-transporting ATPase (P-type)
MRYGSSDARCEPHYALPRAEVLARLDVSVLSGLTDAEAARRLKGYGPNTIVAYRRIPAFRVLMHQFESAVVYLLSAAALLAFYFREWEEGGAITVVLGSGLIKSTIRGQLQGTQKQGNCGPTCHNGWRCA